MVKCSIFMSVLLFVVALNAEGCPECPRARWDSTYHYHSDSQFNSGKNAIDALKLNGAERILDVGCGTGRTTHYCAQKLTSGSIVAIDSCEEMITFAQQEYKDTSNISFATYDATQLSYHQEFDLVFSFFCLHWVSEPQKALAKIAQSLKPKGRAIIYVSYDSLLARNWDVIVQRIIAEHPEWKEHCDMYACLRSPDVWKQWSKSLGLSVFTQKNGCSTRFFSTFDDALDQLKVMEIAPKLNEQERNAFMKRLITELYAVTNTKMDEPLQYFTCSLMMELTKS